MLILLSKRASTITVFFACMLLSQFASGDTSTKRLASLLKGIHSFSADFVQSTLGANGRTVRSQRGIMLIERPNKFRWEVNTPLPLLVVSDGEDVYVYDADLAQVTISKSDPNQFDTPAVLLSGDTTKVADNFAVVEDSSEDGSVSYTLKPLNSSSPYQHIKLTFSNNELFEIAMKDSFGQYSIVQLANRSINQPLAADTFSFVIPPDVDVFRNDLP